MKILALDFDGVIADSQYECLFIGFNNYLKIHKDTKLFDGIKITFENFNDLRKKHKETVKKFIKFRPYVIDAFCYYAIIHIIDKKLKIDNQTQYNQLRNELIHRYKEFVNNFYEERFNLQNNYLKNWLQLEKPYPKIIDAIKKLKNKYIFTVATNNRKLTVQKFLSNYKLEAKTITDSTLSIDKLKHIEYIKDLYKVNFNQIYFVDDQVRHFPKLIKKGVKCYLAAWGYNNEKQPQEAKKQGATILNEDNFYKEFENIE